MTLHVEQTTDVTACRALRRVVFIEEQGVSLEDELDELDEVCTHFLAIVDAVPVGTVRVHIEGETAKIARVCVLLPYRGKQVGVALIKAALDLARGTKCITKVKLGAQVDALGFYKRLGFGAVGLVYDDAGIPHRDMVCDL